MNTTPNYPVQIVDGLGLNLEQRLYVIANAGGGFSCFGFDNCFAEARHLAGLMHLPEPDAALIGTRECYALHRSLIAGYAKHPASKKTWYRPGTPAKVAKILEAARASYEDFREQGTMLRVFYGCTETGRDYCEEFSTVGYVSRSMGPMRVPLLIEPLLDDERNITAGCFGDAINTAGIVRIIDVRRAQEVYRASNYVLPQFRLGEAGGAIKPARVAVLRTDQAEPAVQAYFDTEEQAAQWIAFMQGHRVHQEFRTARQAREELEPAS